MMGLRELYHRLRGRRELYQVYTNITYSTPEHCLEYHGTIVPEREEVPSVSGCDFEILAFPVSELPSYKEKKERMEELVEREIERRTILREGEKKLEEGNYEEAISDFKRSARIDVFLPELEDLAAGAGSVIPDDVSEELRKLFVLGYKEKFGLKRYERLPEKMREDRKEAGIERIRELFG